MSTSRDIAVERLDLEQSNDRLQVALHQQRYDFVLARLRPEDCVLEVGTGTGGFSRMVAGRCKEFTGLEFDASACGLTRSRLQGRGAVFQGDAQAMPFPSRAFSVVVCLEVLEHLEDYRRAVGEIHRCLKPDGRAMISVPYRRRGGPNPGNRFHIYEPGERELVAAFSKYFSEGRDVLPVFRGNNVDDACPRSTPPLASGAGAGLPGFGVGNTGDNCQAED